jgi:hypothetical protein
MTTRRNFLKLVSSAAVVATLPRGIGKFTVIDSLDTQFFGRPMQFIADGCPMPEGLLEGVTYYVTGIGPNSYSIKDGLTIEGVFY